MSARATLEADEVLELAKRTGMLPSGVLNVLRMLDMGWTSDAIAAQGFTGDVRQCLQLLHDLGIDRRPC